METFQYLIYFLGLSLIINTAMFLIAFWKQTDKVTDITYSLTFIALASVGFFASEKSTVDIVILSLVVLWAIRLGGFLLSRVRSMGRDKRFDKMRPKFFNFLAFWMLQAISVFIVSLSFLFIFREVGKIPNTIFYLGVVLASLGLILETTADFQKNKFKNINKSSFMDKGVWKYIRHPNYLGEILFWLGIFTAGSTYLTNSIWIAFLGPVWIIILLTKLSGIPLLEKKWEKTYGTNPAFRVYQKKSWRLIPYLY